MRLYEGKEFEILKKTKQRNKTELTQVFKVLHRAQQRNIQKGFVWGDNVSCVIQSVNFTKYFYWNCGDYRDAEQHILLLILHIGVESCTRRTLNNEGVNRCLFFLFYTLTSSVLPHLL